MNSVAGEDPLMRQYGYLWQADLKKADAVLRQALTSHIITAKHAAVAMMPANRGLIVEVTENDLLGGGGKKDPNFLQSESPLYVGRAVAALAADPKAMNRTGMLFSSWELARDYGFTDYDGRRPDWAGMRVTSPCSRHHSWIISGLGRTSRSSG